MRTEENRRCKKGVLPAFMCILYSPDQFLPFLEKIQVDEVNEGDESSFFAIAGIRFRWHRNFRARGDQG